VLEHPPDRGNGYQGAIAMTTLFDSAAPVKSDRPFGTLPARERRMPYTQADLDWAAQSFGELEDYRQLEEQALQAQWDDQFRGTISAGFCRSCGELAEVDRDGLCADCERAGTEATIKGENHRAGLGYRTF
jgi:hypothetical protein